MKITFFILTIIVLTVFLPLLLVFVPTLMAPVLSIVFLSFILLGILWFLKALVTKNKVQLMISFPFVIVIGFCIYISFKINLHYLFLGYLNFDYTFSFTEKSFSIITETIIPWFPISLVLSTLPVIFFSSKLASGNKIIHVTDIPDSYYPQPGTIISLHKTNMRINKVYIYNVVLSIGSSDTEKISVKVKFLPHLSQHLQLGNTVTLYLNDKKDAKKYIKIGDYLY